MPIRFNPDTGYYEDEDGNRVERDQIGAWIDTQIDSSGDLIGAYTDRLIAGDLSVSSWEAKVLAEIKDSFTALYLLGRGGVSEMVDSDWVALASLVDRQDFFLARFGSERADGLVSDAETVSRALMYANAARQSYYKGLETVARGLGNDEEAWFIRPVKTEHCQDCIDFEKRGYQPIGTFPEPGDGSTTCLSNCRCYKLFRNSQTGVIYG